jgi:hypothetical protein
MTGVPRGFENADSHVGFSVEVFRPCLTTEDTPIGGLQLP